MRNVRYTERFDYRPRAFVVMARAAGVEVNITEAEYEAANAAGAVEIINGESPVRAGGAINPGNHPWEI